MINKMNIDSLNPTVKPYSIPEFFSVDPKEFVKILKLMGNSSN